MSTPAPIVVGVDDSAPSTIALEWAVQEAGLRRLPLRIVHGCLGNPPFVNPGAASAYGAAAVATYQEQAGRELLDRSVRQARTLLANANANSDVTVTGGVTRESGARVLLQAAKEAAVVVVGSRGLGGITGQLMGSVSLVVAAHAPCPVVVVRTLPSTSVPSPDPRPVVVGVDTHHLVEESLAFAFEEAAARGAGILAVHAAHPFDRGPNHPQATRAAAETDLLEQVLEPWHTKYPAVPVRVECAERPPSHVLVDASPGAQLTVLGARRRHAGMPGMALGPVNHAVLHYAFSPVAVVPAR